MKKLKKTEQLICNNCGTQAPVDLRYEIVLRDAVTAIKANGYSLLKVFHSDAWP